MRIDMGKIKLKVKYVKKKNFTFMLSYSSPYPCTLPHIPVLFPISLYLSHISGPFAPYLWTSHPISLDP